MHILCPHCQNPIEVVDLKATEEVVCPSCGSNFRLHQDATRTWTPGDGNRTLGHFELIEAVGVGAFGTVYKARDSRLGRTVAIKVPRSGNLSGSEDRERFLREARSVAQLRHPAIVPVHDVGEHEGLPYLVSEFVQGKSLADLLTARRPSPREAARLIAEVADALQYAHEKGVIHRDVKPSNIMLDDEGHPHLMDFGLAKRDAGEVTMTIEGQLLGTPAYMSPEQARGEGHVVDGRSDVYSLGIVLYLLLTGELPFRGNTRMLLDQVLHDDPRPPRRLSDRVARDLETVCLKAMAKEPARRYHTARELAEDMRRFLAGEPIKARPVAAWERSWRWARRRPAAAALVAVSIIAVMALAGIAVGLVYNEKLESARYFNSMLVAEREWMACNVGRAEHILDECPVGRRGWEWHCLKRMCHTDLHTLVGHSEHVWSVAYSRDGKRIVSSGGPVTEEGEVIVWDAVTGDRLRKFTGAGHLIYCVAFSPDRNRIAASSKGAVTLLDAESGKVSWTTPGLTGSCSSLAFSPDGALLATASGDGDEDSLVTVLDVATGKELRRFPGPDPDPKVGVMGLAFSPDGERLAIGSGKMDYTSTENRPGLVQIVNPLSGDVIHSFPPQHKGPLTSLAFSPDGNKIATSSEDRTVKVWDAETGDVVVTFRGHSQMPNRVTFSPNAKVLASAGEDNTVKVWDGSTGEELLTLRGHTREVANVAFSPDGRQLASASFDGTVKLWDASRTTDARTLGIRGSDWVEAVAFSPDGMRVASACVDNKVRVWDLATGRMTFELSGHSEAVLDVAFSPDGKLIASCGGNWKKVDTLGEIIVWKADTGQVVHRLSGHARLVRGLAFSNDGKTLYTAGDEASVPGQIISWDLSNGSQVHAFRAHEMGINSIALSHDGRLLASSSWDNTIKIWNAATGQLIRPLIGHNDPVWGVAFSPDDKYLASASADRTAKVWDVQTGKEICTFLNHNNSVLSVAFSADGTRVVSAGGDYTLRIWDPATGLEALTLRGHSNGVWRVAFSRDGSRLASASQDGTVKIWDGSPWTEPLSCPAAASRH